MIFERMKQYREKGAVKIAEEYLNKLIGGK